MLPVRKKDSLVRICIDFGCLNVTVPEMPRLDIIIDCLGIATFLSLRVWRYSVTSRGFVGGYQLGSHTTINSTVHQHHITRAKLNRGFNRLIIL